MSVPRERTLYLGAAISTVVFAMFAVGAKRHVFLGTADKTVWRFFSRHGVHTIHVAAHNITSLGVVSVLIPLSLLAGIATFVKTKSIAYAVAPFFSLQITATVVSSIKKAIHSVRPPLNSHIYPVHNAAFPSGHAADTAALVTAIVVLLCIAYPNDKSQRISIACGATVIAVMALTRLLLNVHWLSDVMGGAAMGIAIALVVSAISMRVNELLKSV